VDYGWIQAFNADGTSEVILNQSDGLVRPAGANGLAFDANGNLYVANYNSRILRFPSGGGPAEIFADQQDGLVGPGALDFAPNGELFYGGGLSEVVIRIMSTGEATVFDDPPFDPASLAFNPRGTLFVSTFAFQIYRYDNADPGSRRSLATFPYGPPVLAMSSDRATLYAADYATELIYTVDPDTGATALVADVSAWRPGFATFGGMVAYPPPIAGDFDADGDADLRDFSLFRLCSPLDSPFAWAGPCPGQTDMDEDGDTDLTDFAMFGAALTGPLQGK
jgi:sugar lactone lactonase YvrE